MVAKVFVIGAVALVLWVLAVVYLPMRRTHARIARVLLTISWWVARAVEVQDPDLAQSIRGLADRLALRLVGVTPHAPARRGPLLEDEPPLPSSLQALVLRTLAALALDVPRSIELVATLTAQPPIVVDRVVRELRLRGWIVPLPPDPAHVPAVGFCVTDRGVIGIPRRLWDRLGLVDGEPIDVIAPKGSPAALIMSRATYQERYGRGGPPEPAPPPTKREPRPSDRPSDAEGEPTLTPDSPPTLERSGIFGAQKAGVA